MPGSEAQQCVGECGVHIDGQLRHYTSLQGLVGILKVGHIVPSLSEKYGAKFGPGVYFTEMVPTSDLAQLKWNNYDGADEPLSKLQFYIEIPKSSLKGAIQVYDKKRRERNIWLLQGKPFELAPGFNIGCLELATLREVIAQVDGKLDTLKMVHDSYMRLEKYEEKVLVLELYCKTLRAIPLVPGMSVEFREWVTDTTSKVHGGCERFHETYAQATAKREVLAEHQTKLREFQARVTDLMKQANDLVDEVKEVRRGKEIFLPKFEMLYIKIREMVRATIDGPFLEGEDPLGECLDALQVIEKIVLKMNLVSVEMFGCHK